MTAQTFGGKGEPAALLTVWRHPKPRCVSGRCIGRTDVSVDPRKAKNLAHRIRAWARCHGAPRVVVTSALQRSVDVGRWLAAWGWKHRIDARLNEVDFGVWDGQYWDQIGAPAIDAWCVDFADHAPGGGESVRALLERCGQFIGEVPPEGALAVGHAGWISAARWLQDDVGEVGRAPTAAGWPRALGYGWAATFHPPPEPSQHLVKQARSA